MFPYRKSEENLSCNDGKVILSSGLIQRQKYLHMNNKYSYVTKVLMKYEPHFIATDRLLLHTSDNI